MYKINRKKKQMYSETRKTIAGIKLPPMELIYDDSNVKTILGIDPTYYSLIEDRPIRPNTTIHAYKRNIKEVALKRTVHGFLVDEILRIEREMETEKDIYKTTVLHFEEYQNSFDKFLADDNNKTITVMKKSDSLARDLVIKTDEFKKVNHEMASFKSKLQYIDETLMILLSFQRFLNKASPILWQEKHNLDQEFVYSELFNMDGNIFRKIDSKTIVERFRKLPAPKLYFESPDQLLSAFSIMEKQNLNYLLATEELNSEKNKFVNSLNHLKKVLHQELDHIQQMIQKTEEMIKLGEDKQIELKQLFHKILSDKIRYLVSSEMVLQVFNYVEFAYEKLIAPNETKLSPLNMAIALEKEYDNLMLDISAFNLDELRDIEIETYKNTYKEIEQAQKAYKLLKDVDKLNRKMKSSYDLPLPRKL